MLILDSTETQPAFTHSYQYVRGTKLGLLKVNQAIAERLDQDPLRITLHPRFLPMVVKPKPWLTWESGSYLVHSSTCPSRSVRVLTLASQLK